MFKSTIWRSDKNNKTIKIVFKLQFHATQVSDLKKGERLKICVVPGGDVSSISTTVVDDGDCCRWETPLYETVKFNKDFNTNKKLNHKKIYRFVVSKTGGFVRETSCIDFLDYVDSINNNNNTCIVSLPLLLLHHSNSNSNPILHISIQRHLEETLDMLQSVVKEKNIEAYESRKVEESPFGKASSRIGELRRRQGASIESVSTLPSFKSVSELGEVGSRGDRTMMHHYSESEWSGGSDQGISSTDDSMNSSNDTTVPRDTLRTDDEVDKLKAELVALARRADLSELELQSLRKQIVKETKRSQDLLREVTVLKQERDSLKADCDSSNRKMRNKLLSEGRDPQEELDHEKDLNSKLRLQLEKTQESNTELINAVQELEEMLGHRRKREVNPLPRHDDDDEDDDDDDEDQKALDELVKGHMDAKEAHALERRITDLYNEIEMYKRDKDDLEIQLEQLALDYEILKQSQVQEQSKLIECIEAKLKKQMEEEIEKQGQAFEADIEAVMSDKVKQEKRAIEAEEAMRKSRLRNVCVAGKIQDEFKRISEQMASTLAANEKMTKKAMTETKELRLQKLHLEELLMNGNDEIGANKMVYEAKLKKVESKTATARSELNNKLCQRNQEEIQCAEAIVVQNRHVLSSNKSEDLVNEIASLREEYEVMKIELKEMQERYSEISLRFAQVEGERQQLVMTLRCLKIAKNT